MRTFSQVHLSYPPPRVDKLIYRMLKAFGFVLLFFNLTPLAQLIKRTLLIAHQLAVRLKLLI